MLALMPPTFAAATTTTCGLVFATKFFNVGLTRKVKLGARGRDDLAVFARESAGNGGTRHAGDGPAT